MTETTKQPDSLKILFADDEKSLQKLMSLELPRMGHRVTVCPDGTTAMAALEKEDFDCLLVDLDMPGKSGIDVIAKAKELAPDTDAIILTGKSSTESAIAAVKFKVFAYLTKPCRLMELKTLLEGVAQRREQDRKIRALTSRLERAEGKSQLIGDSRGMHVVNTMISKVAPSNSAVMIRGETGTGKELVAKAIHDQSLRSTQPFVAVNCGALPENLIESELFGHRKGAFTGADETRIGLFEVAHGGSLFLDEIGELPKSLQAKLLRVLETGEIRRVGENVSIKVDVRIISATHRDLEDMVREGDFREDLMFRINTFEIQLPSLRERAEDIPLLAEHLSRRFWPSIPMTHTVFATETIHALKSHHWPGNVRELANVVEHATILCEQLPILPEHLPRRFSERAGSAPPELRAISRPMSLRELEMQAIHEALERHAGNKPQVAEELGVSLKTLYNKLNQATISERTA